jgi:hypothetical protein
MKNAVPTTANARHRCGYGTGLLMGISSTELARRAFYLTKGDLL